MDALFAKYDSKAIVQKVMGDWGMGLYHGGACKATAENGPWAQDLVVDASGMDMKNTDIYKKYYGINGLCEWFANQEQISFKDFKIDFMFIGREGVILQVSNTPTFKDGKITAMKFYFGDAVAMDALFGQK